MKKIKEYFFMTIGFLLVSLSIKFFLEPNKIAGGGTSGIAIILNHRLPNIPVGLLMMIMDTFLFTLAIIIIGKKFGVKTLYSSFGLSSSLWFMDKFITMGPVTNNMLLATIFGTLICGVGMGIVFNQNASTGGTDIIAKILNKFLHIDIGKALLLVDFTVTIFAGTTFGAEIGMYSLLAVIINGLVIDNVIEGFNICKQVMVISKEYEKISKFIIEDLDRGCTALMGKGGYTWQDTYMLYTVLSRKEFIELRTYIKSIDKNAFITITDAREVLGNGFNDIIDG